MTEIVESQLQKDTNGLVRMRRHSSDGWIWEVISSILSLVCLAAIIIILSVYNDKTVPHFSHGITLNAIVSILATASKSLVAVAVASALGQLKWHWFYRGDGRLYDLQIFDVGSRGPFGAAYLAGFVHVRSLALLGAIVTLCFVAIDPFAQQLLTFPTRTIFSSSPQAQIPQARNFTSVPDLSSGDLFTDVGLSAMVTQPLYQGIYSGSRDLDAICTSGNCSWPSFHSLSWRTQCQDKTSSIGLDGCDFSFDPDAPVNTISQPCSISTGPNDAGSIFATRQQFDNSTVRITGPQYVVWPTVDFTYAASSDYAPDGTVPNAANNFMSMAQVELGYNYTEISDGRFTGPYVISVTECSLVPCVQEYSISMSAGRLSARILSTAYGSLPESSTIWSASVPSSAHNFTISLDVLDAVSLGLVTLLQGNATQVILDNTTDSSANSFTITSGSIYLNRAVDPDSLAYVLQYRGFESTMHDIASQLTYLTHNASEFSVTGSVGVVESFVNVRWGWLALPVGVVCLGVVFLLATIVATWRHPDVPVWKSSILPFLFNDLNMIGNGHLQGLMSSETSGSDSGLRKLSTLEDCAKQISRGAG